MSLTEHDEFLKFTINFLFWGQVGRGFYVVQTKIGKRVQDERTPTKVKFEKDGKIFY